MQDMPPPFFLSIHRDLITAKHKSIDAHRTPKVAGNVHSMDMNCCSDKDGAAS